MATSFRNLGDHFGIDLQSQCKDDDLRGSTPPVNGSARALLLVSHTPAPAGHHVVGLTLAEDVRLKPHQGIQPPTGAGSETCMSAMRSAAATSFESIACPTLVTPGTCFPPARPASTGLATSL